jgi:hypothetical protein
MLFSARIITSFFFHDERNPTQQISPFLSGQRGYFFMARGIGRGEKRGKKKESEMSLTPCFFWSGRQDLNLQIYYLSN